MQNNNNNNSNDNNNNVKNKCESLKLFWISILALLL